ncbi:MAG TPA: LytR C-terminal domain-containing protein [Vitreimonas sp.]|nr:LytR C-terminal domain-containing protein [Vitreimonas sp.]
MNEQPLITPVTAPKKKLAWKTLIFRGLFLILVVALAATAYLYYQTRQEITYLTTEAGQQEMARREVEAVTSRLKKLTILPEEDPVVATILDPDYLASQSAFYQKSEKGDKLVVYPQAQKAYIYSPGRDLIVNAGPLIVQPEEGVEQTSPAEKVSIEVRNGSNQAGAGTAFSQQLNQDVFTVTQVRDAANKNYTETLIVVRDADITDDSLSGIAQATNGRIVRELPSGETASTAQIVVIIGG